MPGIALNRARCSLCSGSDASSACVYGMLRRLEDRGYGSRLDLLARVHDHDAVRGLGDHGEIMRDQQQSHPALALQATEQIEHLRLDRYVQRGGRFVGDQQSRLARDRHRNHHALRHAAGKLVRKRAHP